MDLHWSVGRQISARGAGLGNEIFPWAKAYLASQALNLVCVDPAWRLNPRRYDRQLGGNLFDSAQHLLTRSLPSTEITSALYRSTDTVDYYEAIRCLQSSHSLETRRPVLLHSSGMSGGYLAIRRAKHFLRNSLLGSKEGIRATTQLELTTSPTVRVAVHVRAGDFHHGDSVEQNAFNQVLPLEWYRSQLETLAHAVELPLEVFLATDGQPEATAEALALGNKRPQTIGTSSISDLAILAGCDILISSVSSFSMLAAFLSEAPYIWHKDQLGESGGWLSIWGHEPVLEGGGPTQEAISQSITNSASVYRGQAHCMKPVWSSALIQYLMYRATSRIPNTDLIHYGVVPSGQPRS